MSHLRQPSLTAIASV